MWTVRVSKSIRDRVSRYTRARRAATFVGAFGPPFTIGDSVELKNHVTTECSYRTHRCFRPFSTILARSAPTEPPPAPQLDDGEAPGAPGSAIGGPSGGAPHALAARREKSPLQV